MVLLSVVLAGGFVADATNAEFSDAKANPANTFSASYWDYVGEVEADGPSMWWRLGEVPPAGPPVFTDDFEGSFGWSEYGSGTIALSSAQARSGTYSLLKDDNNDPNGGWTPIGFSTGTAWSLEVWIYRPSGWSGGGSDRVAVEDAAFDGYGVLVNHNGNSFQIERRTAGSGSSLASTSFNPPEDAWYRVTLVRAGPSLTAAAFDAGGTLLASVAASDTVHGSADLFVVHGGNEYYVDDVAITAAAAAPTTVAVDTVGNLPGTYVGSPMLGQASLTVGETDTSVRFDGTGWVMLGDSSLLNIGNRSERSVELWFNADAVSGRQVLYEEGGSTNGMLIYLDGSSLRARAWSRSTSWTNDLDTVTTVGAGQTHHVVVTLDTVGSPNLVLYLDGVQVDSAAKGDGADWSSHSDDGGIAAQNGSTRYHDGTSSGSGSNGFSGIVDEVAIYNSVLDPARVLRHWTAGTH